MRSYWITGVVLAAAGAACASSQGEQVRDARMEQAEAHATSQENVVEHNEAVRDDSIEHSADRARDDVAAANGRAESANKQLVNVSEDRAKYQSEAQARLEKLGVQINEAQQKLNALGGRAPTQLKGECATASQQYRSLQRDVNELKETPPDGWEAKIKQVDERMSNLDTRISELKDDIEDVS